MAASFRKTDARQTYISSERLFPATAEGYLIERFLIHYSAVWVELHNRIPHFSR
jgi:hypothetical protein